MKEQAMYAFRTPQTSVIWHAAKKKFASNNKVTKKEKYLCT